MSSVHIELRVGESIVLDQRITVRLEQKSGQRARLNVLADKDVEITRPSQERSAPARMGIRVAGT